MRPHRAFTLLEMLVALAVVSLMMVFMFNVAGQTVRGWEVGNRRMESAQTARIGMNLIANELRYAFASSASNASGVSSAYFTNIAPFLVTAGLPGETSATLRSVPGSSSIFFTAPIGPYDAANTVPFAEVGFLPVFVNSSNGIHTMIGPRYYLVRHGASPGRRDPADGTRYQDFYYRSSLNTNWVNNPMTTGNRTPLVDNCIRFSLQFASNNNGSITWTTNWSSQTNLPLGVLITMLVLDNKSATRLEQLNGTALLTSAQIDQATNGNGNDAIARTLREGTTVIRRFVPLVNSSLSP